MTAAGLSTNDSELVLQTFVVHKFEFEGNTVFTSAELEKVVETYTNRPITGLDLEEARVLLTQYYITNGYVNSGALLDRLPTNDLAAYRIVEGKLTTVKMEGNRWTRERFYRNRLVAGGGEPLNVKQLHNTLQVWREAYSIEQVNAELKPGARPGEAELDVKIKEKIPFHFGLQYANDKTPSTGPEQVTALLRDDSLTGLGDRLCFDYGVLRSKGDGMDRAHFLGPDDLAVSYAIPFTPRDTTFGVQYLRTSAAIVEAPFDTLDISSESIVYGVSLSQPLFRTPQQEFTVSLAAERKSNDSYLMGIPYSLSPGEQDGRSVVSALRFSGQYVQRSDSQVFALRATVSEGIDALGATINSSGPDGRFTSVVGQAQYLQRLWNSPYEFLIRVAGQYTPDPLLPLEELSIGGSSTVRGYRENTLVRDTGLTSTAELHLPLVMAKDGRSMLQLVPFFSEGAGWNVDRETPDPEDISSAGIGVVFTPWPYVEASLYYGYAFRNIHVEDRGLQDQGIHFKLVIWAL